MMTIRQHPVSPSELSTIADTLASNRKKNPHWSNPEYLERVERALRSAAVQLGQPVLFVIEREIE